MLNQLLRLVNKYPVYCGWCGIYIHDSEAENSTGVCAKCKKRLLGQ